MSFRVQPPPYRTRALMGDELEKAIVGSQDIVPTPRDSDEDESPPPPIDEGMIRVELVRKLTSQSTDVPMTLSGLLLRNSSTFSSSRNLEWESGSDDEPSPSPRKPASNPNLDVPRSTSRSKENIAEPPKKPAPTPPPAPTPAETPRDQPVTKPAELVAPKPRGSQRLNMMRRVVSMATQRTRKDATPRKPAPEKPPPPAAPTRTEEAKQPVFRRVASSLYQKRYGTSTPNASTSTTSITTTTSTATTQNTPRGHNFIPPDLRRVVSTTAAVSVASKPAQNTHTHTSNPPTNPIHAAPSIRRAAPMINQRSNSSSNGAVAIVPSVPAIAQQQAPPNIQPQPNRRIHQARPVAQSISNSHETLSESIPRRTLSTTAVPRPRVMYTSGQQRSISPASARLATSPAKGIVGISAHRPLVSHSTNSVITPRFSIPTLNRTVTPMTNDGSKPQPTRDRLREMRRVVSSVQQKTPISQDQSA